MKQQFIKAATAFCGVALTFNTISIASAQAGSSVSVSNSLTPSEPIIVTANRAPTLANNVLADYDYIGPEEIAQAGQSSLTQLLQRQRGVEITSGNGAGGTGASVFLRGASNGQSIVLIDGIRSDSGFNGGPTWESIPLPLIDHIEIIFGPQSSLYGSDAIGGVVQIFTKDGSGPAKVSASTGYGTYGTSVSEASIYGATEGEQKIRYSLGVSQTLSTGYNTIASNNPFGLSAMKTGYVQDAVTGKLSQEWSKGQVFGAQLMQSRLNNQVPGFNSGDFTNNPSYSDCSFNTAGPCGAPGPQQAQSYVNQMGTYSLFSQNQITGIWKSLLQASLSNNSGQNIQDATAYSPAYSPITKTKQNIYTWQNDIAIGTDLLQILVERRTQNVDLNQINYFTSCLPEAFSQTRNTNSAAASYQLKRGANLANISIRNDSITGYGPQTTGGASYGYFFTKEWRANINYGTGFRAPSFNDLYYPGYGNPNLQPEKSKNTEVGLHYDTNAYDVHLVGYNNTTNNLIQFANVNCPESLVFGCASNVAVAKISGVSIGLGARLGDFSLKGSFDQQSPINQTTDQVLAKRARTFGNASVEYNRNRFIAGLGGTFSGQRQDISGTDTNSGNAYNGLMGGYSIFNLYSSYEFEPNWTVFARWNNMLNKQYQLTYGYNTPGSNVFAGLRYAMK